MKTGIKFCHLQSLCSVKNVFTAVCTILTGLLIFKELFSFAVLRPTNTYQEEKQLDRSDLPEIVVCPDPGFDSDDLRKYGYKEHTFWDKDTLWTELFELSELFKFSMIFQFSEIFQLSVGDSEV